MRKIICSVFLFGFILLLISSCDKKNEIFEKENVIGEMSLSEQNSNNEILGVITKEKAGIILEYDWDETPYNDNAERLS